MKTQFVHLATLAMVLAMALSACHLEEVIEPKAWTMQHQVAFQHMISSSETTNSDFPQARDPLGDSTFGLYNILHLEVTGDRVRGPLGQSGRYDLDNTGPIHAIDPMLPEVLVITGQGDAYTDDYGRAYTTLNLRYHVRTGEAEGTIYCDFYPIGSHLEFEISGRSFIETTPRFNGPHEALILATRLVDQSGDFAFTGMEVDTYVLNATQLLNRKMASFDTYVMVYGTVDLRD